MTTSTTSSTSHHRPLWRRALAAIVACSMAAAIALMAIGAMGTDASAEPRENSFLISDYGQKSFLISDYGQKSFLISDYGQKSFLISSQGDPNR